MGWLLIAVGAAFAADEIVVGACACGCNDRCGCRVSVHRMGRRPGLPIKCHSNTKKTAFVQHSHLHRLDATTSSNGVGPGFFLVDRSSANPLLGGRALLG